jgi:hypothetical protein
MHDQRHHLGVPDQKQAIRTKIPYVLARPTIDDLIEDTNIRMYNLQADNPTSLTESSLNSFLKAKSNFEKREQRRREEEAKVCHLILSSLSEEAQMHLRSVDAFPKAVDDNDSFAMFSIAKNVHSRSSSFAVALHIFQQLKKDGSFSKLIQEYRPQLLEKIDGVILLRDLGDHNIIIKASLFKW